jgi:hypothetical protein
LRPNEVELLNPTNPGIVGEQQRQQFNDQVSNIPQNIAASTRPRPGNTILQATSEYI